MSAKVHLLVQERDDIWIEGLPVRVFQVVFLGLGREEVSPTVECNRKATERRKTYTLVLETLNNGKCSWVMDVLHHKPIDGLLVLAVNPSSLNEFGLDALNGVGLFVCIEVDGECIDHDCCLKPDILGGEEWPKSYN